MVLISMCVVILLQDRWLVMKRITQLNTMSAIHIQRSWIVSLQWVKTGKCKQAPASTKCNFQGTPNPNDTRQEGGYYKDYRAGVVHSTTP